MFFFFASWNLSFLCPNLASKTSPAPLTWNVEKKPNFMYRRTVSLFFSIFPHQNPKILCESHTEIVYVWSDECIFHLHCVSDDLFIVNDSFFTSWMNGGQGQETCIRVSYLPGTGVFGGVTIIVLHNVSVKRQWDCCRPS